MAKIVVIDDEPCVLRIACLALKKPFRPAELLDLVSRLLMPRLG